jgi:DNA-binding beta-propeller fold protein YncE
MTTLLATRPAVGAVLAALLLPLAGEAGGVFTQKPAAVAADKQVRITFAVDRATDVAVVIEDAHGVVVRHLAAGLLGTNAPAPFQRETLRQALGWDLRDDAGRPAVGGPFRARVQLGLGAELDHFIPAGPELPPPCAIGVGPDGSVCAVSSLDKAGGTHAYILDKDGNYLRTILPSPVGLKKEQLKGLARIPLADGKEAPVIYSAFIADFAPHLAGFRSQQLAVSRDGWIAFASGGNNWTDQIVPRRALVLRLDGTTPPEVGFVGPPLGPSDRYSIGVRSQQLALSPDGKTIYFAGMGLDGKTPKGIHCIGRTTWDATKPPEPFIGKPDESGSDDTHFNNPTSVATDGKGNIYVVDAGNARIAAFTAEGKPIGQTHVERPLQVAVGPSGALYVLTEPVPKAVKGGKWVPFSVIKFDRAAGGKELARLAFVGRGPVLAVDPGAAPDKLWLTYDPGWKKPRPLLAITDAGDKLAQGHDVLQPEGGVSLGNPLFLSMDPRRERLYVVDSDQNILKVDLKTDLVSAFLKGSEITTDAGGNLYVLPGYGRNVALRFDPEGKPLPFPATGKNQIEVPYRAGGPNFGVRGITVSPAGDIYLYEEVLKPEQLHVFGPDGSRKQESLLRDIPVDAGNGVAVDRAGNVYAGINVHDPARLYPDELLGAIPPFAWERTYAADSPWYALPQHKPPQPPWDAMYLNNYLYLYGCIFKFPPSGGRFWTGGAPAKEGATPRPEGVPAGAAEFRTGLLGYAVWCQGALWNYRGFGLCGNRSESSGDPTCSCFSSRFCLDEHDRLLVPDVFRNRVTVLDGAGNELLRIGSYGNVDSAGARSAIPEPGIPLAFPNAVAAGNNKVYILDRKNRRIAVVRLTNAAEETVALPEGSAP